MVREYLEMQLPVRAMAALLYRSTLFSYLAAATPGLQEMVTIGKVWELTLDVAQGPGRRRTYDLVIVDAPATGHGVGFLQTPRTFRRDRPRAARSPIRRRGSSEMITDPARSRRRRSSRPPRRWR